MEDLWKALRGPEDCLSFEHLYLFMEPKQRAGKGKGGEGRQKGVGRTRKGRSDAVRYSGTISHHGYVTTGFGKRFFADAISLCLSIRFSGDTTNFAIITSPAEAQKGSHKYRCGTQCMQCQLLPFTTNASLTNPHDRYNVDVMLALHETTPFEQTIFFDSDVLRTRPCNPWSTIFPFHRSQPVVMLGHRGRTAENCGWHFGWACELEKRNGQPFPVRSQPVYSRVHNQSHSAIKLE